MQKPLVAIDIDDVIADSTEALRLVANQRSGLEVPAEAYKVKRDGFWGYYEKVWAEYGVDKHYSFDEHRQEMEVDQSAVFPIHGAIAALKKLDDVYRIVLITSRSPSWQTATMKWLESHLQGIAYDIHFLGHSHSGDGKTKGQLCKELGVELLIDDSEENCSSAVSEGVAAIRFGDYGWHGVQELVYPSCKTWKDVLDYLGV